MDRQIDGLVTLVIYYTSGPPLRVAMDSDTAARMKADLDAAPKPWRERVEIEKAG